MRIAHINMVLNGSTGNIMMGIAKKAEESGHISRTYSPELYVKGKKKASVNIPNHFIWGTRFESFVHYYLGCVLGINGLLSKNGTKELIKDLEVFKPDVIHLHNLHNFSINLPMLFKYIKKNRINVVWTLHDCWSFTGHCPYFDMVKCDKWKIQCNNCPQKLIYPKTYIDTTKQMYALKSKMFCGVENMMVVTPSEWLAGLVKQSFLKDYTIRVINNGINLSVFKPVESDLRKQYGCDDKYILLGVAFDWGKRKGLDVFIELSKRLTDKYQIILVGTNDNIDRQIPENIISIHRTENQHELAKLYTMADLFVNPTREENYPTVNMEAVACGTPVLTFRTGGSMEMLDDTCGSIVDCDDVDSMVREIKNICEYKLFSEEDCLKRAKEFDIDSKFTSYVELYESI